MGGEGAGRVAHLYEQESREGVWLERRLLRILILLRGKNNANLHQFDKFKHCANQGGNFFPIDKRAKKKITALSSRRGENGGKRSPVDKSRPRWVEQKGASPIALGEGTHGIIKTE